MRRFHSYWTYSFGCAVVWSILLSVVTLTHQHRAHVFWTVFGGWAIGWASATIARSVYPPPRGRKRTGEQ